MTNPEDESGRAIRQLEVELAEVREHAARANKELYDRLAADVAAASTDARAARSRAEVAEQELVALRTSRRWRTVQALLSPHDMFRRAIRSRRG